jgi:hypothetical protein
MATGDAMEAIKDTGIETPKIQAPAILTPTFPPFQRTNWHYCNKRDIQSVNVHLCRILMSSYYYFSVVMAIWAFLFEGGGVNVSFKKAIIYA